MGAIGAPAQGPDVQHAEAPAALAGWTRAYALPFWATAGFDRQADRFHERLNFEGGAIDVPYRAMVQARQIGVYAHAAAIGWYAEGGALAERALAALLRDYCVETEDQASLAFAVLPGGGVSDARRDSYTHAFFLLALARLHALTGDSRLLRLAGKIVRYMDLHLVDPIHDGVFDCHPVAGETKRQNPLMHLFEAYLFLERTSESGEYLARAARLLDLLKARLVDPEAGVVIEHCDRDWSAHPDQGRRDVVEPGHLYEWAWLLSEYAVLGGSAETQLVASFHRFAKRFGIAPGGHLLDELARDGSALRRSNRLWPHAEALKAGVAGHRDGDPAGTALANAMAATLMQTFLGQPFRAGWIDHRAEDGTPLVNYVPASSLYHIFSATSEACHLPASSV